MHRRWLLVLLPIAFLAVVEAASDSLLDPLLPFPRDTLLVMAVVTVFFVVGAGQAFRRIDALTSDLRSRNRQLMARTETLRGLHEVGLAIEASPDVEAILQTTVDAARNLVQADVALLVLRRPDGQAALRARSGPEAAFRLTGDQPGDDVARFLAPGHAGYRLAAPLRLAEREVGFLAVAGKGGRALGAIEDETLGALAGQAAIALENARLQEELRELALAAERERIAREMHDGLAQVLGYVNTKSQAVEALLADGRVVDAEEQLAELSQAARSVYVDVREAILGLSSPIEPGAGLVGALDAYVSRFADASKLAASVAADPAAAAVELGPATEAEIFRIVQEALTNVRKHAAANRVTVRLSVDAGELVVTVQDDGRGFDPDATAHLGWPNFGLRSIRERAGNVGGTVGWRSTEGEGSCLTLRVPIGPLHAEARPAAAVGGSVSPVTEA